MDVMETCRQSDGQNARPLSTSPAQPESDEDAATGIVIGIDSGTMAVMTMNGPLVTDIPSSGALAVGDRVRITSDSAATRAR